MNGPHQRHASGQYAHGRVARVFSHHKETPSQHTMRTGKIRTGYSRFSNMQQQTHTLPMNYKAKLLLRKTT